MRAPLPDDLRIEVCVALARLALGQRTRALVVRGLRRVLFLDALGDRLIFGGRDVAPRRAVVRQRLDLDRLLGHQAFSLTGLAARASSTSLSKAA